jgi:tetratricopeptide (TPR) repeat protein
VSDITPEQLASHLAVADKRDPERLLPAIAAAEAIITQRTHPRVQTAAIRDFRQAVHAAGVAALDGSDPQRLEDALVAATPDTPLAERVMRQAWLALVDHLARSGDKPPFGGTGRAETWAWVGRSRAWPFVDAGNLVSRVSALYGQGLQVVSVRGPGRSAFLSAVRRALLGKHGIEALIPPVLPAAQDELAGVLRPYVERGPLPEELRKVLPQIRYGEDLVGLFGRLGDQQPVSLLLDDAHLQSRAILLGMPLFLEPAPGRQALLVLAAPDNPQDDGPLADLLADAAARNILTQVALPQLDPEMARHLIAAYEVQGLAPEALLATAQGPFFPAERLRIAHAMLADPKPGTFSPEALMPKHARAREVLAVAALEGDDFHGFAVGRLFGKTEDDVEDLLFDDEFELEGELVGTCENAVSAEARKWVDLADGLHPVFPFTDMRLAAALRAGIPAQAKGPRAGALRDVLLEAYGPAHVWQIADRLYALDVMAGRNRRVEGLVLGVTDNGRIEAGFRRLLPVLNTQEPYRLALARLYGAAMEAGAMAAQAGQVPMADQAFQAAAAAAERLGRAGPAGEALARLAEIRLALALPQPTVVALDLADKLLNQAGHKRSAARLGLLRAEVSILEGNLDAALGQLEGARTGLAEQGDPAHAALALVRTGRLLYERGQAEEAEGMLDTAVAEADKAGDPRARAASRMARSFVAAERGHLEKAFQWLQEAAQLFQAVRMPVHIVETAAAGLQRRHGGAAEAEKRLRAMAEAFQKGGAAVQWADAWQEVGRALMDQDKSAEALAAFDQTLEVRRRARDRFALIRLHEDLGRAALATEDSARAATEFGRARRLAERLGLSGRLGALDADLARLESALVGRAEGDLSALRASASADIDTLEAQWAAPLQTAPQENPEQVH